MTTTDIKQQAARVVTFLNGWLLKGAISATQHRLAMADVMHWAKTECQRLTDKE